MSSVNCGLSAVADRSAGSAPQRTLTGTRPGGPCKMRREAHASILTPPRRSTVAALTERLRPLHACRRNAPSRCNHARGPSIPAPGSRAAPAPSGRACHPHACVPLSRGAASLPVVPDRPPPAHYDCVEAAAVAAPPHASSECAGLPEVLDKPRLCTPVVRPLTFESTALMPALSCGAAQCQ